MGHNRPAPYGQSRLLGLEKMYLIIVQVFAVPLCHVSFCELVPPKDSSCLLVTLHFRHMQEYAEYTDPPASQRHKATSRPSLLRCAARVVARNMVLWVSFVPAHGNLAKGTCILDIRWLLLMETLSPCGHSFHLSKGRWSFHSEKSWHQFLLGNCMLQAGSGTAPGNGVAGIAKHRPANRGEAITPGGVSLLSSSNLKGGVNACDVRLPRREPFH